MVEYEKNIAKEDKNIYNLLLNLCYEHMSSLHFLSWKTRETISQMKIYSFYDTFAECHISDWSGQLFVVMLNESQNRKVGESCRIIFLDRWCQMNVQDSRGISLEGLEKNAWP